MTDGSTQGAVPTETEQGAVPAEVGDVLAEREFTVTRADLIRYAGASGDFNPLHWSDRIAKDAELPSVISHGMLTMALAARVLTDWAGDPGAVVEYGARFARPVVVPDDAYGVVVTASAAVRGVRDDGLLEVELTVRAGEQKVLTQARAVVRPRAA
jgi:acyl dehydratase